ncbi:MAG: nuclear transport factor 2 family protein [Anaerobacillus sp.]
MATAKEKFLHEFNEAFIRGDKEVVLNCVTDDIKWTLVGEGEINGKEEFEKAFQEMPREGNFEISIKTIITHGITAAAEGTIQLTNDQQERKAYAFCETYRFNKFKDGRIKEMTSYMIEVKAED